MTTVDSINLSMTSDRAALTECGRELPVGTTVEYVAHVVRAVKVRLADGAEAIVNPNIFPQLRDNGVTP